MCLYHKSKNWLKTRWEYYIVENYPEDDGYLIRGPSGRVVTTSFYQDNLEAYEKGDWEAIKKYFDENGIVGIEHNGRL